MKAILALSLLLLSPVTLAAVVGKTVEYEANGVRMKGWLAHDDAIKGKRPGVLVVHEWWGLNDYARKRASMLAEAGYVALAVDMYGDGKTADNPKDAGMLAGSVNKNPTVARARFAAAEKFLNRQPLVRKNELAALGYCFGGGVVLNMARNGEPLRGVVSYHGVLATDIPVKPGDIKGKVRVFTGEADPIVPPEQVEAFRTEMTNARADWQLVSYPGVKHTFTNPEADTYAANFGLPLKYDAHADHSSWAHTLDFLKSIFRQ
jgi:dienelactone hydrolase